MKKLSKKFKTLDKKPEREILKRLDRIHKENKILFKEDKILLRELKKEIDAQQRRKAS